MITAQPSTTPLQQTARPFIGEPATTDMLQVLPDASTPASHKSEPSKETLRVVTRIPFVVRNNEVTLQEFLIF